MKKILALVLALCMVFALCACGAKTEPAPTDVPNDDDNTPAVLTAADVEDTMTSEDGTYAVAFVTDIGQLKDKSFNEGTWNGVKLYAAQNNLSYKYYQPANSNEATDTDRYDAMKAAVDGGAKVVVCAGFLQGTALTQAAAEFPDTNFVFIDNATPLALKDGTLLTNVASIQFQEEQCGYFAGYAVVSDGFTKLGFCGGGGNTNPACCKYGYGFVQGASAAAQAKGVEVEVNYSWEYGSSYSASPELQTMATGWYQNGTEVIFACGGSMFQSVSAAASASDGYVVGVDVDQAGDSDTVITSAMKGLSEATMFAIGKSFDGAWADVGGKTVSLGVNDDAVGIPTAAESWRFTTYTVDEYNELLAQVKDGTVVIDNEYPEDMSTVELPNITVTVI